MPNTDLQSRSRDSQTSSWGPSALWAGRHQSHKSRFENLVRTFWIVIAFAFIGYPVIRLFLQSIRTADGNYTLQNWKLLTGDPQLLEATLNSVFIAAGTLAGSLLIGLPLAWLVVRTDVPFRRFLRGTAVLTFAAPSFIAALGWVLLLGPRSGMINAGFTKMFGLDQGPFNIFSPWGIIFVLSMFMYPLVFLPVSAALEGIDPALEHAAASLGASRIRVLRTITFPIIMPAIIAGSILVFVTSAIIFGPVAILGAPSNFKTLPVLLLNLMQFPPHIEAAAVVSVPILVMISCLLIIQRFLMGGRQFTVIGGKPSQQSTVKLGAARPWAALFGLAVFTVSIVLPFGVLLLTSFRQALGRPLTLSNITLTRNYKEVFSQPTIVTALVNSFVLAIAATVIAMAVAVAASWLRLRTRARGNGAIGPIMLAPLAFPGAVFAIGLIIAYAARPFDLGGTRTILLVAYVASALPLTFVYVDSAMGQIGAEVEEASRSLGASWLRTWRKITIPLLRPALLAALLLNFVLLFRELEMSIFLYTGANPTVATVLYDLAGESLYQRVGALSTVVLAVNIGAALLAMRLLDRTSSKPKLKHLRRTSRSIKET